MSSMTDEQARLIAEAVGQRIQLIVEPLSAMTRALDQISERLHDIDRRVIHLEASRNTAELDLMRIDLAKAEAVIGDLVAWKNRMAGAAGLFDWVKSSWPFVLFVAGAIGAYLKFGRGE